MTTPQDERRALLAIYRGTFEGTYQRSSLALMPVSTGAMIPGPRAENGMETVALQRYMAWEDIKTALHYVHLCSRRAASSSATGSRG